MSNLEYYVYHLRPYGILSGLQDLNVPRDIAGKSRDLDVKPRDARSSKSDSTQMQLASQQPQVITKRRVVRVSDKARIRTVADDRDRQQPLNT